MKQEFDLASGKTCQLIAIRNDLIRNYYLLAFPREQGEPAPAEITEMLNLGIAHAKQLAGKNLAQALGLRKDDAPRLPR